MMTVTPHLDDDAVIPMVSHGAGQVEDVYEEWILAEEACQRRHEEFGWPCMFEPMDVEGAGKGDQVSEVQSGEDKARVGATQGMRWQVCQEMRSAMNKTKRTDHWD